MAGADMSGQAIKYFILDSRFITTMMFMQSLLIGSLITKSIKMSFYLWSRIGNGFKKPLYILCEALAY